MVAPWIRPGLDGDEPVLAIAVGARLTHAEKVRVERRREGGLAPVHIAPARVGLPDLDQRVRDRTAVLVEHATSDDAPLPDRFGARAGVGRQIRIVLIELRPSGTGPGRFGERLNDRDE